MQLVSWEEFEEVMYFYPLVPDPGNEAGSMSLFGTWGDIIMIFIGVS